MNINEYIVTASKRAEDTVYSLNLAVATSPPLVGVSPDAERDDSIVMW